MSFSGGDVFGRSDARVAVTFDDGYLDNVVAALPILERHEIPATIFVIGNAVGRTREFWWDALERAILAPRYCPVNSDRSRCRSSPVHHRRQLGPRGRGRTLASRCRRGHHRSAAPVRRALERDRRTRSGPAGSGGRRIAHLVWPTGISATNHGGRQGVRRPGSASADHRRQSHLDHLSLTDLSPRRQREQIHGGHRRIENSPADRSPASRSRSAGSTIRLSPPRELGVDIACTSVPEAATVTDDRHTLPRLQALDIDGDAFARWLRDDHRLLRA